MGNYNDVIKNEEKENEGNDCIPETHTPHSISLLSSQINVS